MTARLELQHSSPLTWQSRYAPRKVKIPLPPSSWSERATKHRELCPILQGQRPPKPQRVEYSPISPPEIVYDMSLAPEPPPVDTFSGDDEDGDYRGVLCRVELSRYIARKNAYLAALAETSRQQRQQTAMGDGDWQGEVPGAHAETMPGLEDASAWSLVVEALSFERRHLKRGSSNGWPDAYWSPACLSCLRPEALVQLDVALAQLLPHLDGPVCDEESSRALPVPVFMRQLLSDVRLATGDLHGASAALAISKSAEPESADPLRPLLLIAWEDALDCDFLKAHHCFRLGRLAIVAARTELLAAQAVHLDNESNKVVNRVSDMTEACKHTQTVL